MQQTAGTTAVTTAASVTARAASRAYGPCPETADRAGLSDRCLKANLGQAADQLRLDGGSAIGAAVAPEAPQDSEAMGRTRLSPWSTCYFRVQGVAGPWGPPPMRSTCSR